MHTCSHTRLIHSFTPTIPPHNPTTDDIGKASPDTNGTTTTNTTTARRDVSRREPIRLTPNPPKTIMYSMTDPQHRTPLLYSVCTEPEQLSVFFGYILECGSDQ